MIDVLENIDKNCNGLCYNTTTMAKKNLKILLVEDEDDAVESITRFLVRREFEVLSTPSGKKAIEIIKDKSIDLVLLDLSLEDITGIEALEQIREFNKSLKIVVVTGSILQAEDREKVYRLGIHQFLAKPSNSENLLDAINGAVGQDEYLPLSEFPVWQYEPARVLDSRHALKGLLGALNLQCVDILSDIESKNIDDSEKYQVLLEQLKDVHERIKKACKIINDEIVT